MTTIRLGNAAPISYDIGPDGADVRPEDGEVQDFEAVTTIRTSPDSTLAQALHEIERVWRIHSDQPPTWVECADPVLAALISEALGCEPGEAPEDVEDTHYTPDGPPGIGSRLAWPVAFLAALSLSLLMLARTMLALRTGAGRDHQARTSYDTASTGTGSYAAANYIALTENATAPAAGDTSLAGEIAVAGLNRQQGTYAHTNGTAVTTITKTFTMTAGGNSAYTLQKAGMLNASSGGTLVYSTLMPNPPTLVAGDQVAVTWTFTI